MKRHRDKLSLRQPTGTPAVRATGFSKEQAGICFDLYVKEFATRYYLHSLTFNVDETGLTVYKGK